MFVSGAQDLQIIRHRPISHLSLLSPYLLSLLTVYVVSEVSCRLLSGPVLRQGIRGPCPPKRVTVPPTFHSLPSLLNVIDFESESETDKTEHIRKRLHALASISNCTWTPPPNTHTHVKHTTWFVSPWWRCPGAGSCYSNVTGYRYQAANHVPLVAL